MREFYTINISKEVYEELVAKGAGRYKVSEEIDRVLRLYLALQNHPSE